VEDDVLSLLREQAAREVDQGLTVAELAQRLDADPNQIVATLEKLQAEGRAYEESFWWYPGRRRDLIGDVDQT
jgi:DNA-binding IclR family transcriptional regulator